MTTPFNTKTYIWEKGWITTMTLRQRLRQDFALYIRPLLIKSKCEVCGKENEVLHLHHVAHFQDLLDETLEQLQLEYYEEIDNYSKEQLQLIRDVMLGKQMKVKYVACCESCHLELHNGNYFKSRTVSTKKYKTEINEYTHEEKLSLVHKLEQLVQECKDNEYAFVGNEGRTKIYNILNLYTRYKSKNNKTQRIQCKKVDAINKQLLSMNLPFKIDSTTIRKKVNGKTKAITYYTVVELRT